MDGCRDICNISFGVYEMFSKLFVIDSVYVVLYVDFLESDCFSFLQI